MRTSLVAAVSLAVAAAIAAPASGQYLMVPHWETDKVLLFDAETGALVNADFISEALGPINIQSPREAIQVGDEIWVSEQLTDAVFRFTASLTPAYVGTITGAIDNLRGMAVVGDRVYLANGGTDHGAPGDSVIILNFQGGIVGSFSVDQVSTNLQSPLDIEGFEGDLLISDLTGDDIERWAVSGAPLGTFHNSNGTTGINLPAQVKALPGGEVLAAGISPPRGIYRYSRDGAQIGVFTVAGGGIHGVWPLGNGDWLITQDDTTSSSNDGGVKVYDPDNQTVLSTVAPGDAFQYINSPNLGTPTCAADFNGDALTNVSDIFAFLSAWFAQASGSDFNGSGTTDVSDIFAFLSAWFAGCP